MPYKNQSYRTALEQEHRELSPLYRESERERWRNSARRRYALKIKKTEGRTVAIFTPRSRPAETEAAYLLRKQACALARKKARARQAIEPARSWHADCKAVTIP